MGRGKAFPREEAGHAKAWHQQVESGRLLDPMGRTRAEAPAPLSSPHQGRHPSRVLIRQSFIPLAERFRLHLQGNGKPLKCLREVTWNTTGTLQKDHSGYEGWNRMWRIWGLSRCCCMNPGDLWEGGPLRAVLAKEKGRECMRERLRNS